MAGDGYVKAFHCVFDGVHYHGVKGSRFHLFYYIYRRTIGWNEYLARISIERFVDDTGLSRPTVVRTLAWLEAEGWIHVMREISPGGLPYNLYCLGARIYRQNQLQNVTSYET